MPNSLIKRFLRSSFFKFFPSSDLKDTLKCFWYNRIEKNKFKIYRRGSDFIIVFEPPINVTLKFHTNPYYFDWSANEGYLMDYLPKPGDIVVDGGAYMGTFTLVASKLVGQTGKIIAFEPDPVNYEKLLENIGLNKATTSHPKTLRSKMTIQPS